MRKAYQLIKARVPKLEIDGEMMADTAWDEELRHAHLPQHHAQAAAPTCS